LELRFNGASLPFHKEQRKEANRLKSILGMFNIVYSLCCLQNSFGFSGKKAIKLSHHFKSQPEALKPFTELFLNAYRQRINDSVPEWYDYR